MSAQTFEFKVDLNVINHLGVGLYSSTPAALTELISNAWDAEAQNVWISVEPEKSRIVIEDDGHGMNEEAVSNKFLRVGYSRRSSTKGAKSENDKRRVMGRKGIGKLSIFALADQVNITTMREGEPAVSFDIDVPKLKAELSRNQSIKLDKSTPKPLKGKSGTKITLTSVHKNLSQTEAFLRVKLARRFSVLGQKYDFKVILNGHEIVEADRDIHDKIQFLWHFDDESRDRILALSSAIAKVQDTEGSGQKVNCVQKLSSALNIPAAKSSQDNASDSNARNAKGSAAPTKRTEEIVQVRGYIASVAKPSDLGAKEDSANIISIFANGRVFAENILSEVNSAKLYQSYLTGEVHADFLDEDDVDRATASREAIKKDDPKYQALRAFVLSTLTAIGDKWDDWRSEISPQDDGNGNAAVNEWVASLADVRDQRLARRLMNSIGNATIHADNDKNKKAKSVLYRGAIIGFEKLKIKNQLDRLTEISDVLSGEFAAIFSSLSEVEEAAYYDITKQRLEVIKHFQKIKDSDTELEKVAQKYLFDHLWLLDPSWDRVSGAAHMEVTLTEYIKRVDPDSTGARLDISYRASSGRHIVIELKRPSKKDLSYMDLSGQARKYRQALNQYYRDEHPNSDAPPIDIYILVSKKPTGMDEQDYKSLAYQGAKIITYSELIHDSYNSYREYLEAHTQTGRLEKVLSNI